MADTQDYKKQVAVIVPRWCLDMLLDHLDMQYETLLQEQEFYHGLGDVTETHRSSAFCACPRPRPRLAPERRAQN